MVSHRHRVGLFFTTCAALTLCACAASTTEDGGGSARSDEPVFCTLDVKLCPDGSSVGRVAPSCAFAPCPGE
ncbi:MAG: hypothetical protein PHZ00_06885 [Candidatus Peribacteraceae bacterium]|nr:hypothetical protein [Candidatus Peribacteraceae bacterium]